MGDVAGFCVSQQVALFRAIRIPHFKFSMQIEIKAEMLTAGHGADVDVRRKVLRGNFGGESSAGRIVLKNGRQDTGNEQREE